MPPGELERQYVWCILPKMLSLIAVRRKSGHAPAPELCGTNRYKIIESSKAKPKPVVRG